MGVRKLHMRQAYRIIPVYTADVSGVCSALYELGGMTVIHDPSGCNSTYNTHDEIRWYDEDSLIFISGLTDIDAIMGNDEGFLQDIRNAAEELKPGFISLVSSPIPYMNGTDFAGLAEELEAELGIPVFSVPTSGMHDYVYGAGLALAEIAERFTGDIGERNVQPHTVNLLGVTPLDFGPQPGVDLMKKNLEAQGVKVLSTWAMGSSTEEMRGAGDAEVNLVVSSVGIPAANVLQKKFGTPFVVGTPLWGYESVCAGTAREMAEARKQAGDRPDEEKRTFCQGAVSFGNERMISEGSGTAQELWKVDPAQVAYFRDRVTGRDPDTRSAHQEITLIGEPVTMGSLAASIEKKYGRKVRVLCPLEITEGLLAEGDCKVTGEQELEERLSCAEIIVADPLYRPVCPGTACFYELPHIAFSGRIYLRDIEKLQKRREL